MEKKNIGSSFDSLLREDGIYEDVRAGAITRVHSRTVKPAKKKNSMSTAARARKTRSRHAAK